MPEGQVKSSSPFFLIAWGRLVPQGVPVFALRLRLRRLPLPCKKNVVVFLAVTNAQKCNKPLNKGYLAGSMAMGGAGPSPRRTLLTWVRVPQSTLRCIAGRVKASFEGLFAASTIILARARHWAGQPAPISTRSPMPSPGNSRGASSRTAPRRKICLAYRRRSLLMPSIFQMGRIARTRLGGPNSPLNTRL
jgi:hypothetical protein